MGGKFCGLKKYHYLAIEKLVYNPLKVTAYRRISALELTI